jgi:tetratricopeptide (TPR) repeat protein
VRRGQVALLLVLTSGLFSVLLAVAVNVATGGRLPGSLAPYAWLAWPAVGALAVAGGLLALWQQRLADHSPSTVERPAPAPVRVPAPRPAEPPGELPAAPVSFGLTEDLAAVDRALAGGARVVVLAAAPGTGKTSLALQAAHGARARYPDGQLYASLRGASAQPVPPEAVLARFLDVLGRPEDERRGGVEELAARFRSAAADRKLLVLLDDAADAAQVRPLLAGGAGCLTIVTSRRLLADLPGAVLPPVGGLRPDEALALLAVAAGADRVAGDPEGARRIVAACGGLSLAVRLAGGRLRARPRWTPAGLADRLEDEGRRLDELRLGDHAVRSGFLAAYEELPEPDRLVFRRAGAHPGQAFGPGTAAARCGLDERTVSAVLDRLVDAFLVESPVPDRYRLHDLLRLFATEMLVAQETPGDRAACLSRQIDWLCAAARPGGWLAGEGENVLAVLRAAVAAGLTGPAWTLALAVRPLLTAADHGYAVRLWQAGESAAGDDDLRRARALRWLSDAYSMSGQVQLELPPAQRALALAQRHGDREQTARAAGRVGQALRVQNRLDEAEVALTRALDMFVELGEVPGEIEVRVALGSLYNNLRRPGSSVPVLERAVRMLPSAETSAHGWPLLGLGIAYRLAGRLEESAALTDRAFGVARRLREDFLLGYCFQERAWLLDAGGRPADAQRDLREMLAIFERIGHGGGVGAGYEGLGVIAGKLGHHPAALDAFDAGIAQYERLGDRRRVGELRLRRTATLRALGREADAVRERAEVEALIGDTGVLLDEPLLAYLPDPDRLPAGSPSPAGQEPPARE